MKKIIFQSMLLGVAAIAASGMAHASSVSVADTYWGGNLSSNVDSFGGTRFDISGLTAERSGNDLTVTINTNYADNVGASLTQIGSLFIGDASLLNLVGTGPAYTDDTYTADTDRFSYVFDYDIANSAVTTNSSGTGTLYSLKGDGSDVRLSFGTVKRMNQAVDRTGGTDTGTTGTWSVGAGAVTFKISDFFAISGLPTSLTLAWAMSCANDVILTTVQLPGDQENVPLPAGVLLLASGLGGLGFLGRRKAAK